MSTNMALKQRHLNYDAAVTRCSEAQQQQQQQQGNKCTRCKLSAQQQQQLPSITALPAVSDNFGSSATLPLQQQQQHYAHVHQPYCTRNVAAAAAATPAAHTPKCSSCRQQQLQQQQQQQAATMNDYCCHLYNNTPTVQAQIGYAYAPQYCVCDNWQQQRQQLPHAAAHGNLSQALGNGCYFAYEHGNNSHLTDEEDSAFPALADRELHMLYRSIPALRRTGVDTSRIRQYFYPDGGWGWIICGVSFLVHILTTGLQLSYGILLFYAVQHLHHASGIELLGALSWSVSMLVTPFVVALCRKRSIRLLSIVGGLILPLGILFTSFANEFAQVIFSYGIVFGMGVAMVREASTIMLGNYFKRRRKFVELVAMSGEGVGIALFSVILKEGVGKAGWRLGLQLVAALTAISFFMGLMYRPASLYHPQRRAIQHLKNQRKKLREKKSITQEQEEKVGKYFFLDISSLKSLTVKILLMTSAVAAFGIYTPIFLMALCAAKEGADEQELVLLQTFLGISMTLGVVLAGALLRRTFFIRRFVINSKIVAQLFICIVALAILFLSFVMGYRGLCILSWLYGIGLGGFQYSLKILALERIKLKHFSKAWGFIRGIESIPVLISVPLTSFLNDYSLKYGRAGYYICSAAVAIAGIIIFFIHDSHHNMPQQQQQQQTLRNHTNGSTPIMRHGSTRQRSSTQYCSPTGLPLNYTYAADAIGDYTAPDLLSRSCISLNHIDQFEHSSYCNRRNLHALQHCHHHLHAHAHPQQPPPHMSFRSDAESMHNFAQGSIGARMGKRLQRSLSFMQQQTCCDAQQLFCSCHSSCHQLNDGNATRYNNFQPLICTCSPLSAYAQSLRSRSVPEGLSTMSQQCNCRLVTPSTSREYIYVPNASACSSLQRVTARKQQQQQHQCEHVEFSLAPHCRLKRSQSLCRPVHFVEQITTSV